METNLRYKVRQEKEGAFLFDIKKGKADSISEQEFQELYRDYQVGKLEKSDYKFILYDDKNKLPALSLAAPSRIYFELTRRCTLRCKTCFNESSVKINDEITKEEIFDFLKQLSDIGTFEIRFTGGEPTVHEKFFEIINYAKSLGFYISVGTNGVYSEKLLAKMIEAPIDWFIISIEGSKEIHEYVRGKGSFDRTVQTIQELGKGGRRIRMNTVVAKYNIDEIDYLADFADKNNVESLNLIPVRPYGRFTKFLLNALLDSRDFYRVIQKISLLEKTHNVNFITTLNLLKKDNLRNQDRIVQKKRTCAAGVEAAVISASGEIYGCSYSPASDPESEDVEGRKIFVAGNLRDNSIKEIWYDDSRWAVFRELDKYKNPKCHDCKYYTHECVGSCPIMAYYETKELNTIDPYCFVDMIKGKKDDNCNLFHKAWRK